MLAALAAPGAHAHAQPDAMPSVRVVDPGVLVPGVPAAIDVFVRVPQAQAQEQPLLLTPSAEGEAVRVVRGRLLRADARREQSGELHFQVPIEVRGEGTAVLRFRLLTYACAVRCEAVRAEQSLTVQVRGR
jgi:hypothetical protein